MEIRTDFTALDLPHPDALQLAAERARMVAERAEQTAPRDQTEAVSIPRVFRWRRVVAR